MEDTIGGMTIPKFSIDLNTVSCDSSSISLSLSLTLASLDGIKCSCACVHERNGAVSFFLAKVYFWSHKFSKGLNLVP